jgi:hypothetical protein
MEGRNEQQTLVRGEDLHSRRLAWIATQGRATIETSKLRHENAEIPSKPALRAYNKPNNDQQCLKWDTFITHAAVHGISRKNRPSEPAISGAMIRLSFSFCTEEAPPDGLDVITKMHTHRNA